MITQSNFSMFTAKGNELVANIVDRAKRNSWTWPKTYAELVKLSKNHPTVAGEATDTAVREVVYTTLNFTTEFYCM